MTRTACQTADPCSPDMGLPSDSCVEFVVGVCELECVIDTADVDELDENVAAPKLVTFHSLTRCIFHTRCQWLWFCMVTSAENCMVTW